MERSARNREGWAAAVVDKGPVAARLVQNVHIDKMGEAEQMVE